VIGSRAVEDREQEGLVGDGSYELHTGDIPSTPDVPNVGMDEETPMAAGSSPLSEIKEIPLATRFWRIEPRSTARDIPTSPQLVKAKAGPVEAVPAASRAPPRSTLAPIPRSPPVTISPLIPRASPVPKPVPTTIAETGGLPSSNLLPPVFIDQPRYRATPVSSVPPITHLSPWTSRIVPDAAMTNVNSLDRSGGRIVHPPNDYMRTTSHPASAPLRTPLTPATPYNSRGTAAGPSPSSPADEFEDEAARRAAKRKSGWANWLKKQAGAKQRTLEEWHEERIKRRRGIAWMRMMIEEFGLAPSPGLPTAVAYSDGSKPAGSVMSFANTLAALGHPAGPSEIKRLGGPGPGKGKEKDKQKPKEKEVENRREQEEDMAKITPPATATQGAGPSNAPLETHFWTASIANGPEIETAIPTGSSKRWAEIAEQFTDSQSNKRGRLSRENDAVSQAESWDEPAADYPSSSLIPAIEQDANHAHDAAVSLTLAPITAMKIGGHDVDLTDVPSTPAPPTALESANARIDANGTSLIPTPSTAVETGNDNVDTETPLSAKETAKRKAIAARNGAPMGWAFVDPNVKIGSRLVSAVEPDLLRSARRSRASLASLASEEAIGGVSGQRRESFV
jgi:hypothetical protein